jgi:hypothetical protein
MESWILVLLLVAVFLFVFWRPTANYDVASDEKQGVPPDIIQVIIEAIQKEHPDEVPLETLFINSIGEGRYSARFMFLNTQGFFGTQYDVQAEVTKEGTAHIASMSTTAQVDKYDAGFTAYKSDQYTDYTDISKALDAKLSSELKNYRENPTNQDVFSNDRMKTKYDNVPAIVQTASTNSYTSSPGSSVPGPSPARSGGIVAAGAPVFNSA